MLNRNELLAHAKSGNNHYNGGVCRNSEYNHYRSWCVDLTYFCVGFLIIIHNQLLPIRDDIITNLTFSGPQTSLYASNKSLSIDHSSHIMG